MTFNIHTLIKQLIEMKNNYYIHFFILSVIFDILTGYLKNLIGTNHSNKKLDSSVGIKGLIKHGIVLLLVLVLYPYMVVLNFITYANSIVLFYIFNYGISIIENLNDMGIKLPNSIRKYLKWVTIC